MSIVTDLLAKPGVSRDDPNHVLLSPDGGNLMFYPENITKGLIEVPLLPFLSANLNGSYVWNSYGYQGTYGSASGFSARSLSPVPIMKRIEPGCSGPFVITNEADSPPP